GAGGVDREGAVGAEGGGLVEFVLRAAAFEVGSCVEFRRVLCQAGLGQAGHVGREERGVVGPGDVDGDRGQRAVGALDRERVAVRSEERRVGKGCGGGGGPGAGGDDREGAVGGVGGGVGVEERGAV